MKVAFAATLSALALALALAASPASAQEHARCDDGATERADGHYREAYDALGEGLREPDGSRARLNHFMHAKRLFEAAFDACPHARYAFALAAALRQFGEYRASLSLFQRLVDGELPGELLPEQQATLASVVEELRARVAELRVRVRGVRTATLRVDGEPVGRIALEDTRAVVVNPGRHLVDALSPGFVRAERTIDIESGERRNVLLTLRQRDDDEGQSIVERPLFSVGIAAVVAAGITLGLVFTVEQPLTSSPLGTVDI